MPTYALLIPRVSSNKQREEDQTPGLIAYAKRKGYVVDQIVPIHGRSAFHGRHVKKTLAAVDRFVKHGRATVVIFRHVDRESREGVFKGIDLMNKIMDAGAKIEFSEQEYLNDNPGLLGIYMEAAREESKVKQDRKLQGNEIRRSKGLLVGRVPWGYDPVYGDGLNTSATGIKVQVNIKPNALGRKWIPLIFDGAINGKSRTALVDMLNAVPSPQSNGLWNETTVGRILRNTTYCGAMPNNPFMEFEPLVSVEVFKQANEAIAMRRPTGRSTTKHEPAFVRPYCGSCWGKPRVSAPRGRSPMYRNTRDRWAYYICSGEGSGRKSCGAPSILVSTLDALVDEKMAADSRPRVVRVPVAGDDSNEQRDIIGQKISAAAAAGDFALVAELSQQAMAIKPSEHTTHIEDRTTGKTVGKHWQTLTRDEKREELTNWLVLARVTDGVPEVRLTWRSPWETASIDD